MSQRALRRAKRGAAPSAGSISREATTTAGNIVGKAMRGSTSGIERETLIQQPQCLMGRALISSAEPFGRGTGVLPLRDSAYCCIICETVNTEGTGTLCGLPHRPLTRPEPIYDSMWDTCGRMTSEMSIENHLLQELPSEALTSFRAECQVIQLTSGDVLLEPDERIRDVYFPTQSIVSLVAKTNDGATLEVLLVGDEGMIGLPLLFGADRKHFQVLVQKSGTALSMKAETFTRMANTSLALRSKLNEYALWRLAQLGQNAICANAHQIEARLARRLLMMRDRSHSDQFHATQESLASMLGVRRSSVTIAAVTFQKEHFIEYNRGTITVIDWKGLERTSCECYGATPNGRQH